MKRPLATSFVVSLIWSCSVLGKSPTTKDFVGVYEYAYEHNTPDLIENHYIELRKSGKSIAGTYYGTSDDFDDAREGYLPGFYKAPMSELKIKGSLIGFKVRVEAKDLRTKAITPYSKGNSGEKWKVGLRRKERVFKGTILGDKITLIVEGGAKRIFVKQKSRKKE